MQDEVLFSCSTAGEIDFDKVDLRPFEDESSVWDEDYTRSLQLNHHPHLYQTEIIRSAVHHRNSIIFLPTGCGKTLIGGALIKYYLIKKKKIDPNCSFTAIFLIPRKSIRIQQAKAISAVGNIKVRVCTDEEKPESLIYSNDVIVLTPQKLLNSLRKGTIQLLKVDVIIFDECHHASGGHPYCEIMKFYLCPSLADASQTNPKEKPVVLSLSASISSKDSFEKKEPVEKNLINICSRLACDTISTVCQPQNLEQMNQIRNRPINNPFEFVQATQYNEHFFRLKNTFVGIIQHLLKYFSDGQSILSSSIDSHGFMSQLAVLKQIFERKGQTNDVFIAEYIQIILRYITALNDLPVDIILEHILSQLKAYYDQCQDSIPFNFIVYDFCSEKLKNLLRDYQQKPTTNSKLDALITLLKRHLTGTDRGQNS